MKYYQKITFNTHFEDTLFFKYNLVLNYIKKEITMGRPQCKCKQCGRTYGYGEDGKGTTWNYCSWKCQEDAKK